MILAKNTTEQYRMSKASSDSKHADYLIFIYVQNTVGKMDVPPSRQLFSQGISSRTSGLSPEKVNVDVQRHQTLGINKNQRLPSRDHAQVSTFARLWHDRLLSRKAAIHKEFQVELNVSTSRPTLLFISTCYNPIDSDLFTESII